MEKQTINVPGAEALARPQTRKGFLKTLAAASVGAAAGASFLPRKAWAQQGGDIDIANFALTLEFLEAEFYAIAINSGVLAGQAQSLVAAVGDHENQHVQALTGLIQQFGGTPVAKPTFTFPPDAFSSEASILNLAATFEPVGVGAYLGAAPMISDPNVLAAAASIEVIEGEHVVAFNNLVGVVPPANTAFPEPLSKDAVLAAIAPFLGGAMPATGGQAPVHGTGKKY